jgi:hypothetical protein
MPKKVEPVALVLLSPMQAAAALQIPPAAIYEALRTRRLVARMYGARRRIAVAELLRWYETWPEAPRDDEAGE